MCQIKHKLTIVSTIADIIIALDTSLFHESQQLLQVVYVADVILLKFSYLECW